MHMFGGWSGLLGATNVAGVEPKTLKELDAGKQLFPDAPTREYASLLRDPKDGKDLGPLARFDRRNQLSVALIGGGIANVIAAYELTRCGIRVTLFEEQQTLGGRMRTEPPRQAPAPPKELGATRFPAESRLLWHYVRAWAAYKCQGTGIDPDAFRARAYPDPGVVPSFGCYQNTWFRLTDDVRDLPRVMREAADLWISFLAGLNDGIAEPQTKYLPDIQQVARRGGLGDDFSLFLFWKNMRRRFEHKSLGEVLQTEVFAPRRTDVPSLMHAFGSVGLGTGGFGALFDVAFLEVLRNVVWNTSGGYLLPSRSDYPLLYPADVHGTAAFVDGLAHLAHASGDGSRDFNDMFRTGAPVVGVTVRQMDGQPDKVVVASGDMGEFFDFAIIALSSRAMQEMGLGQDSPGGPFTRLQRHTEDSLRAVEGIQAAIHQLNMVSAHRLAIEIDEPADIPNWPRAADGSPFTCFVTDRYAQMTSLMPQSGAFPRTQAVVTALGNDALKFQASHTAKLRKELVASSFDRRDDHEGVYAIVGRTLREGRAAAFDWNEVPGFGGGFKLDLPGSTYLSGCLFYHSLLAGAATETAIRPYSRVFLAGDSVGFLGGWAEGAAMSALNAVTAVLVQCEKQSGSSLPIRSRALVSDNEYQGFSWTSLSPHQPDLPRLKGSTWLADCSRDQRKPGTWRYDGAGDSRPFAQVAISQDGSQMVAALPDDGWVYHRKYTKARSGWEPFQVVPGQKPGPIGVGLAISCDVGLDGSGTGLAQILVINANDWVLHAVRVSDFKWSELAQVPRGGGNPLRAGRCAIVVVPGMDVAYVSAIAEHPTPIWGKRNADGTWQDFQAVPAAPLSVDVAVAAPDYGLDDNVVFGCAEEGGNVGLAMRRDNGTWTAWLHLPMPTNLAGTSQPVVRISLVCHEPGRGRILASCSDGNAYQRRFDVSDGNVGQWRPVPFPHGEPYVVEDVALGNSVDWRDPVGSATVWSVGGLRAGDVDRAGDGQPALRESGLAGA
ncbi:MAG: flavin monoamine oxidase family protein [Actinomycetales bacterium]